MPDEVDTVPAAIRSAQKRFGERPAVVTEQGGRISYTEFAERIQQAGAAFVAAGVRPGDRVCLWAPNRVEWMLASLGAQYVGAVLVPLNTRYRGAEAADILFRTRARVLVVGQGFLDTDHVGLLRAAALRPTSPVPGDITSDQPPSPGPVPGLPELRTIVTLFGDSPETRPWATFLDAGGAADREQAEQWADQVRADDLADILFTSGTTGRSKGAMAGHRQALGQARGWAARAELSTEDRYLIVNPFFHSFGYKAGFLACLLHGALIVPVPVFDSSLVLDLVEREHITVLPGPPALYQSLLAEPTLVQRDLRSLRLAVTGAAMVPQTLIRRIGTELQVDRVLTAYGLTEAPVVTMCTPEDDEHTVATTCGPPLNWAEVRIQPLELPAEPGALAESGALADSETSAKPGALAEPGALADSETSAKPGALAEPGALADSETSAKPGALAEPGALADSETSAKPGALARPEALTKPEAPAQPETPAEPDAPPEPEALADAETPAKGEMPSEPEAPTEPGAPPEPETSPDAETTAKTERPSESEKPMMPGEVLIRGPYVMLGYLDDPQATAEAIDADGWLHTGDVGVLDQRGRLRITDRIKDMFTVGGFNVYPAEVEQVISGHPTVRDCAVIGVPDERLGEVGRAYVCARPGSTLDPDEITSFCRERLANFKVPRTVVLIDELPRNAGGKVVKPELRRRAALSGQ